MNIKEYTEISKNVEIPDVVTERFKSTIKKIKAETDKHGESRSRFGNIARFAAIAAAIVLLFGTATLSVRAYLKHLEAIRNMPGDEVIALYESVFKYDKGMLSRELSEEEDIRAGELFLAYSNDIAEPKYEVSIIEKEDEYKGKGVAFCKEDGVLHIPNKKLSDEEHLECIEFGLIGHYIISEGYELASNPDHYMNALRALSDSQIDDIYVSYVMGGTECAFFSRELSIEEGARKKALKKLFMFTDKKPEKSITVVSDRDEYSGNGVAFCTYDCTYCLPEDDMTDEDLLEMIDRQIKQEYAIVRIGNDIDEGKRTDWPHVDFVKREKTVTLDGIVLTDPNLAGKEWIKAYGKVAADYFENTHEMLKEYFASSNSFSEEEEKEQFDDYYLNVCFIYLNDDDIPEMLLSHGYTPNDAVRDLSDRRIYLYTYKNGKAVQLRSELGETEGFYAQLTPFRYAERKSTVLCEGHYMYGFFFETPSNNDHDHISDLITQIDHWNFDTLSCDSTAMNIKLEHAVYDETRNETYEDADVSYDYYLDVKEITRDSDGVMDPLKGKKVDEISYDAANEGLWNGESYKTISVSDFDKIYCDYDIPESLAKCYQKQLGNN